jgi:hypothetical protein
VHVLRGLRQALVLVAGCLLAGSLAAGAWVLAAEGSFAPALGVALLVLAFLVGTAGGTTLSRAAADGERAFLGLGPERDRDGSGAGLTPLGTALFVGVPLFLLGLVLLDLG